MGGSNGFKKERAPFLPLRLFVEMTFQNFWIDGGELAKSESASSKIEIEEREIWQLAKMHFRERERLRSVVHRTDRPTVISFLGDHS